MKQTYMMHPAILMPLIPHLTSISYGNLLCTCKEINQTYDYETEWKKRCPKNLRKNIIKKCSMIKDGINEHGARALLDEVTKKSDLYILLRSYQILKPKNMLEILRRHYRSEECSFPGIIRFAIFSGKWIRDNNKLKRDRRINEYKQEHKRRRLHHMLKTRLQLGR
tara:strand:+ start:4007 stop:4504 length:498 start_codon:yes stop_codon:yes gene_type:complete